MCEICAGPSSEIDHRLAINVARAMGPAALRRAFVQKNLRWLCRECHLRKTRFDRLQARYLRGCGLDWKTALRALDANRRWADEFLLPFGLGPGVGNTTRSGFRTAA